MRTHGIRCVYYIRTPYIAWILAVVLVLSSVSVSSVSVSSVRGSSVSVSSVSLSSVSSVSSVSGAY